MAQLSAAPLLVLVLALALALRVTTAGLPSDSA